MESYQKENCKTIANYYGINHQILIAIEEMSELTKELCKYKRGFIRPKAICEEIADVNIMIQQLIELYGMEKEVLESIDYKLERQLRRIENERE